MRASRQTLWLALLLVALLAAPSGLATLASTPVASGTQLYIAHFARFTARVPADWTVLPGWGVVGGGDGLVTGYASSASTLDAACEEMAEFHIGEPDYTIHDADWNGDAACRIEIPSSYLDAVPLSVMVIPHPEPFTYQGGLYSFAAVAADPDHIDGIMKTVSFDLAPLSGQEIAHSLLEYVEALSYHADHVDWDALRIAADTVRTPDQVNRFINVSLLPSLRVAGDTNTFLIPGIPEESIEMTAPATLPSGHMRGNVAYLLIPGTGTADQEPHYIDTALGQIESLDSPQTCGWILDLRTNPGGNLAIILQALTPFFAEGRILGFVDAHDDEIWVTREGDDILYDGFLYGLPDRGPVPELTNPDAPIAVLIDHGTASAGEMTVIGLMSHPDMRTFGRPTVGALGANIALPMLDGSTLVFSAGAMLDTQGTLYTTALEPDEVVISRLSPTDDDATVLAADAWLQSQPSCQGASPVGSPMD